MPVSLTLLSDGIQKMNMPAIANRDSALGSAAEFMEMVFVKICPKLYIMNMVALPRRNDLAGHYRKSMIVWVCLRFGNLNTANHLMNMGLLRGATRLTPTAA